jgi:hypothetical protein
MEANNGYEYRVMKLRVWSFGSATATERAVRRAALEGWELVHELRVPGLIPTSAVTLRRRLSGQHALRGGG